MSYGIRGLTHVGTVKFPTYLWSFLGRFSAIESDPHNIGR